MNVICYGAEANVPLIGFKQHLMQISNISHLFYLSTEELSILGSVVLCIFLVAPQQTFCLLYYEKAETV